MNANGNGHPGDEPPKLLAMPVRPQAKPDPKPVGDEDDDSLGRCIERALALADITKQEASYRMGYRDQSSLSKWIANVEPPRFDKLWKLKDLRMALIVSMAPRAGMRVRTSISVARSA